MVFGSKETKLKLNNQEFSRAREKKERLTTPEDHLKPENKEETELH